MQQPEPYAPFRERPAAGTKAGTRPRSLSGSPFAVFHPGTTREERLVAYVIREHRRGRRLSEILEDPYLRRQCGSESRRQLVENPALVRKLVDDICGQRAQVL
jgi:hypothetical protein